MCLERVLSHFIHCLLVNHNGPDFFSMGSFVSLEVYIGVHPFSSSQRLKSFVPPTSVLFSRVVKKRGRFVSCRVRLDLLYFLFLLFVPSLFSYPAGIFLLASVPYFRLLPSILLLPFVDVCNVSDFSQAKGPKSKKKCKRQVL